MSVWRTSITRNHHVQARFATNKAHAEGVNSLDYCGGVVYIFLTECSDPQKKTHEDALKRRAKKYEKEV